MEDSLHLKTEPILIFVNDWNKKYSQLFPMRIVA